MNINEIEYLNLTNPDADDVKIKAIKFEIINLD